jgi:hypothetical protein
LQTCPLCGYKEIPDGAIVCGQCGAHKEQATGCLARGCLGPVGFVIGLVVGLALCGFLFSHGQTFLGAIMIPGMFVLAYLVGFVLIDLFAPKRTVWIHRQ